MAQRSKCYGDPRKLGGRVAQRKWIKRLFLESPAAAAAVRHVMSKCQVTLHIGEKWGAKCSTPTTLAQTPSLAFSTDVTAIYAGVEAGTCRCSEHLLGQTEEHVGSMFFLFGLLDDAHQVGNFVFQLLDLCFQSVILLPEVIDEVSHDVIFLSIINGVQLGHRLVLEVSLLLEDQHVGHPAHGEDADQDGHHHCHIEQHHTVLVLLGPGLVDLACFCNSRGHDHSDQGLCDLGGRHLCLLHRLSPLGLTLLLCCLVALIGHQLDVVPFVALSECQSRAHLGQPICQLTF